MVGPRTTRRPSLTVSSVNQRALSVRTTSSTLVWRHAMPSDVLDVVRVPEHHNLHGPSYRGRMTELCRWGTTSRGQKSRDLRQEFTRWAERQ